MPRILVVDDEADIVTLIERYELYGGVVRWAVGENKGQIVKHLKPIQASVNDNMNSSSAAN